MLQKRRESSSRKFRAKSHGFRCAQSSPRSRASLYPRYKPRSAWERVMRLGLATGSDADLA
jgi:hypothetical protein